MTAGAGELDELLGIASDMVAGAADVVRRRLRDDVAFRRKADRTLVSAIDLEVEALLRDQLARRFPNDGLLGEEQGEAGADSNRRWVLDPIDGTRSLRHRIPLFGTLLALQERATASALAVESPETTREPTVDDDADGDWRTIVGVVALPALGRLYAAARGLGAFRDGERFVQASTVDEGIDEEILSLGERRQFLNAGRPEVFDALVRHPGARIYPDCFAHVLAAEGALGAMVDFDLKPWDLAATRLVVEEAGGACAVVGRRAAVEDVPRVDVVLGKRAVVDWVVAQIQR